MFPLHSFHTHLVFVWSTLIRRHWRHFEFLQTNHLSRRTSTSPRSPRIRSDSPGKLLRPTVEWRLHNTSSRSATRQRLDGSRRRPSTAERPATSSPSCTRETTTSSGSMPRTRSVRVHQPSWHSRSPPNCRMVCVVDKEIKSYLQNCIPSQTFHGISDVVGEMRIVFMRMV